MSRSWQLQEAKNKLSEVVRYAMGEGPQTITVRGREAVVVLSAEDYRRLVRPEVGLSEFLRSSPLADVELDLTRSRDTGREVTL